MVEISVVLVASVQIPKRCAPDVPPVGQEAACHEAPVVVAVARRLVRAHEVGYQAAGLVPPLLEPLDKYLVQGDKAGRVWHP